MKTAEEYADAAERALERSENTEQVTERIRLAHVAGVLARLAEVAAKCGYREIPPPPERPAPLPDPVLPSP